MNYLRKLILKNKNELLGKTNINEQRMNYLSKLILLRKNELNGENNTIQNESTTRINI